MESGVDMVSCTKYRRQDIRPVCAGSNQAPMQMKFTANPDLAQPPTVGMRGLVLFAVFYRRAINGVVPRRHRNWNPIQRRARGLLAELQDQRLRPFFRIW